VIHVPDIVKTLQGGQARLSAWRRHLHAHPETAFEEVETARFVADTLAAMGIEAHRGLATTGVVGTLKSGNGNRAIGLRADMDALDIAEANSFEHKSRHPGKMHACGHDGHTAMLLGAAHYLAEHRRFDGTVHFIFQPAEENEGGARVMVDDGLFDLFPVDAVFGLHNMPGIPVGHFAVRPGPMMAGFDIFEIDVTGVGTHAAIPQAGIDPIVVAAEIVGALQSVVARSVDPMKAAVLSVTKIRGGDTYNVIPNRVSLAGCTRHFDAHVQSVLEDRIRTLSTRIAQSHGATADVRYEKRYPPTVNAAPETAFCEKVLKETFGENRVKTNIQPLMGSEDFAFMLQARPGCYIWAGNGDRAGSCMVHNPSYDFNDEGLSWGAAYWVKLVESFLPAS